MHTPNNSRGRAALELQRYPSLYQSLHVWLGVLSKLPALFPPLHIAITEDFFKPIFIFWLRIYYVIIMVEWILTTHIAHYTDE